jgi:hypothetical protein
VIRNCPTQFCCTRHRSNNAPTLSSSVSTLHTLQGLHARPLISSSKERQCFACQGSQEREPLAPQKVATIVDKSRRRKSRRAEAH